MDKYLFIILISTGIIILYLYYKNDNKKENNKKKNNKKEKIANKYIKWNDDIKYIDDLE